MNVTTHFNFTFSTKNIPLIIVYIAFDIDYKIVQNYDELKKISPFVTIYGGCDEFFKSMVEPFELQTGTQMDYLT